MRELFLKSLELTDAGGRFRRYDYYIIVDELDAGESYGIRIEERGGRQAAVRQITCSASRIEELAGLVLRGSVTPITLADVVSDWL